MSSAYSCLTCAKSFTSAGAVITHAQVKGHTAHPGAIAAAMAAPVNQVYLCGHCTKRTAFTTPAALRAHVAGRHTPKAPSLGPPPAYSAHPPPTPAHVPRPQKAAGGPVGQANYTCKACANSKFATMDALRAHQAAKHAMNFTPARSAPAAPAKQRPNANASRPSPSAKSSYSEVDLKVLVKTSG